MIALPIGGISDEDAPTFSVLRHILGGFQERLYSEIREKQGYAYWLRLAGLATPTAGWIGVHTEAAKASLPAIERVARAELDRIASEPIRAGELERARRFLTTAEARADATNDDRATCLSLALLDGWPMRSYEERVSRLAAVTSAQVRDLARRLFQGKHYAIVTLQ